MSLVKLLRMAAWSLWPFECHFDTFLKFPTECILIKAVFN